jgi:hypothetical protein
MKRRAARLAAAISLALPAAASAAWSVIAAGDDYFLEFDPDLVREQSGYTMAWTRLTFTQPRATEDGGAKHQSQLQLHAIDCRASASTVVGVVLYSGAVGGGEVVERTTRPRSEWEPRAALSGSLGEATILAACAQIERRGPK